MNLNTTRHASARMQQRGISKEIVYALFDFGRTRYINGACVTDMDRKGLDLYLSRQESAKNQLLGKLRKTYLIEREGNLVTVAIKNKRFKRKG